MELKNCPSCNHLISTEAITCPKCEVEEPFAVKYHCILCKSDLTEDDFEYCPSCGQPNPLEKKHLKLIIDDDQIDEEESDIEEENENEYEFFISIEEKLNYLSKRIEQFSNETPFDKQSDFLQSLNTLNPFNNVNINLLKQLNFIDDTGNLNKKYVYLNFNLKDNGILVFSINGLYFIKSNEVIHFRYEEIKFVYSGISRYQFINGLIDGFAFFSLRFNYSKGNPRYKQRICSHNGSLMKFYPSFDNKIDFEFSNFFESFPNFKYAPNGRLIGILLIVTKAIIVLYKIITS